MNETKKTASMSLIGGILFAVMAVFSLFDALDQFHQRYIHVKFKIATYNTHEALAEALQSDTVKQFIEDTYKGAVMPTF